jgi:hypothetical protein
VTKDLATFTFDVSLRQWTILLCVAVALLLGAWDIICSLTGPRDDTITEVVRYYNRWSDGMIALVWLALTWHFFGWIPESWKW